VKGDKMKTIELKLAKYDVGDFVKVVSLPEKNYEGLEMGATYIVEGSSVHDGNIVYAVRDMKFDQLLYAMDHFELVGRIAPPIEAKPEPASDPVNHPDHYNQGGIETVRIIRMALTDEEYLGYLKGNVLKYRERAQFKGKADQDYAKARWYFDRIAEFKADNR
jgi:Protein of unknwon function (DUF3310)